jgi:hypothetical protein
MPNLSIVLAANITESDTTLSPSPTIVSRSLNNPTLAATTSFYDPFAQVINPTTLVITLPVSGTVWVVYVKHLGIAGNLTVTFTPTGGAPETLVLVPGGVFVYFQPSEGAGGITALSLSSSAATIPAEVLVAV